MIKFLSQLLDFIYKKRCYFCSSSKENSLMCSSCYDEQEFLQEKVLKYIDNVPVYSAMIYKDNIQKLIRGLKYHNQKELAYYLAKFMYEYFILLDDKREFQVVPTPLHKNRIKKRKYNHMDLVVEEFCKFANLEPNYELIKRIKDTKAQYKLTRLERMENLKDAFEVNIEKNLNKPILILDDISTTGATFEEMIKTLKDKNIDTILCLAASSPD